MFSFLFPPVLRFGSFVVSVGSGRAQLCSLICIYGPRTTLLLAVHDSIFDFTLSSASGEEASGSPGTSSAPSLCCPMISADNFLLQKTPVIASAGAKIFAPANLRASQDLPAYKELIEDWMAKRYTLRYSGSLEPRRRRPTQTNADEQPNRKKAKAEAQPNEKRGTSQPANLKFFFFSIAITPGTKNTVNRLYENITFI
eukprot:GHVT01002671.1.p1 GENE.GHVT01002671.1~~GHVT01002671.1.p1  ORF type:complete len:199 (+),score=26.03 GHVT01002671.1:107-703(+)